MLWNPSSLHTTGVETVVDDNDEILIMMMMMMMTISMMIMMMMVMMVTMMMKILWNPSSLHTTGVETVVDDNDENMKIIKGKDDDFIEDLFHQHRNGKIYRYVGDMIVILCKKDKKIDQSLWNSDPNRLTYIIKSMAIIRYIHSRSSISKTKAS